MAPSEWIPGQDFTVRLARSCQDVPVQAGQSILHALLAADLDVAYSCEEGMCGACEVGFLAGEVRHHDSIRAPAENNRRAVVMICCAESLSEVLTLDI